MQERLSAPVPFETENFSITHLSTSSDGFDLVAGETLGKTESEETGHNQLVLTEEERDRLRTGIGSEMRFQKVDNVRAARDAWRTSIIEKQPAEEVAALETAFRDAIENYRERGKKVGLRALQLVDDGTGSTLTARAKIVHFPTYTELAAPDARQEMHDFADVTTVSMALATADGRLIIQHRAISKPYILQAGSIQGNSLYADIPGASAAGHLDASMRTEQRKAGTPDPVDKQYIFDAISKEVEEELGLEVAHVKNMRIAGVANNNKKPNDEFLLLGELSLTIQEVKELSRDSLLNKGLGDADFAENFIDIENSPEDIKTLLTEVKCPMAPTHVALLVAAGYSLELARNGQAAADLWKQNLQAELNENYRQINQLVDQYYKNHPEALQQVPERYWGKKYIPQRNTREYDPAYGPTEQGLPSFEDEMIRTGLTQEKQTRRHVEKGYLLDVDGVITDPVEKRVTNMMIIDELASKLVAGEPVGLNTGRSIQWIQTHILPLLTEKLEDKQVLQNLIIIGEKGGAWATFSNDGTMHHAQSKIKLASDLEQQVKELVARDYEDCMFIGDPKGTMISVEMRDNYDLAVFQQRQQDFARKAGVLPAVIGATEWRIDKTSIATDFESIHSGKALGADRFIEFLKARDIVVGQIEAYGDSASDLAMADELARRGQGVHFVHVGTTQLQTAKNYKITNVGNYTEGTARVLSSRK